MTSQGQPTDGSGGQTRYPAPDLPPGPGRPSFRERVEGHPVSVLAGVAVAAITVTLTVVVPIFQLTQDSRVAGLESEAQQVRTALEAQLERERTEHTTALEGLRSQLRAAEDESTRALADERARSAAQVEDLERSLSSIRRSLGADTEYFDVNALVVDREGAASLPADARYFPQEHWYALDVEAHPGWTYEVMTELQMTADLLGATEEQLRSGQTEEQLEAWTRFPVHLWRYGDDRAITFTDPATGEEVELHPRTQVSVQRVSQDDYVALQAKSLGLDEAMTEVLRRNLQRDPAGWVLQDQLAIEVSSGVATRARIDSLQKREDVAYARVETTLPDVSAGEGRFDEYYWSREWLIITTADDIFLVKLFVADDDHRSPDYAAVSAWLDLFRVLGS